MLDQLRRGGIYEWQGRQHTIMELGTPEQPWRALGLMGHPFNQLAGDLHYVREDGTIIDVMFQPVGRVEELVDTERSCFCE